MFLTLLPTRFHRPMKTQYGRLNLIPAAFIFLMLCFYFILFSLKADADERRGGSEEAIFSYYSESNRNGRTNIDLVEKLIEEGYPYAAWPVVKKVLRHSIPDGQRGRWEAVVGDLAEELGVRIFEQLPQQVLVNSPLSVTRYFLAKRHFQRGQYDSALENLRRIHQGHPFRPFALQLEASTYSILGKYQSAILKFEECIETSESMASKARNTSRKKRLNLNRDYCLIGIPRTLFAMGSYAKAELMYLDLPKKSQVWPEILFEEAWTSFYQGNFNRTLGKLVTYKSPFLDFIFNPEVDVLRTVTYLEMCLWGDTKREVDSFYEQNHKDYQKVRGVFQDRKKDNLFFFKLANSRMKGGSLRSPLLNKMMLSIAWDKSYRELMLSYENGKRELISIQRHSKWRRSSGSGGQSDIFYRNIMRNQLETLGEQRDIIGSLVKEKALGYLDKLKKTFEDLSYIKLEVLRRKKETLFDDLNNQERKRGDIKHLSRNEKQYFWNFNGEFWADELGDYVFSLKSECLE